MKKLKKMGFDAIEIKALKEGYEVRKDNDFCKMDYRLQKIVYSLKNNDFEIVLQESHCGYGKCDFWTEWDIVANNITF